MPLCSRHCFLVYLNSFSMEKPCLGYATQIPEVVRSLPSGKTLYSVSILTLCDFNIDVNEAAIRPLMVDNGLVSPVNSPISLKSLNGKCTDLIITKSKNNFSHNITFETGFSDFYHVMYTILKTTYDRLLLSSY